MWSHRCLTHMYLFSGHSPYLTSPFKPGCGFVFDDNISQALLPSMTAFVQRPPDLFCPSSFPQNIPGSSDCLSPRTGSLPAYLQGNRLVPRMGVTDGNIFNFKL